jgi:hypothetical protein
MGHLKAFRHLAPVQGGDIRRQMRHLKASATSTEGDGGQ